ncbi:MAG: transcriptional repressor [Flavobacteriia bacterium]|nr:transcriptional repressor [Flavobacteriia bacterium]
MADLNHILKSHGLRSTAIRRDVIQYFLNEGKAVSHQDVEGSMPKADRVTLYRTLTSLEESGIIHQVIDDDSVKKYALCGTECSGDHHHDNHVHFKCEKCNDTVCLEDIKIPHINLPHGYKVNSGNLLLMGTCQACA